MRGIAVERYRIRREDSAGFFPDATAAKSPKFKPGNVMMMNNQNREPRARRDLVGRARKLIRPPAPLF
jgi:hypothetical protein